MKTGKVQVGTAVGHSVFCRGRRKDRSRGRSDLLEPMKSRNPTSSPAQNSKAGVCTQSTLIVLCIQEYHSIIVDEV